MSAMFDMEDAQGLVEMAFIQGVAWALRNDGSAMTRETVAAAAKANAVAVPARFAEAMIAAAST